MFDQEKLDEQLQTGSESVIFQLIDTLGGFIWHTEHDLADGRVPEEDEGLAATFVMIAREQIEQAVSSLTRFGFEPKNSEGRATGDYWAWYRWWKDYFNHMNDSDLEEYSNDLENDNDVDRWRPEGDWKQAE